MRAVVACGLIALVTGSRKTRKAGRESQNHGASWKSHCGIDRINCTDCEKNIEAGYVCKQTWPPPFYYPHYPPYLKRCGLFKEQGRDTDTQVCQSSDLPCEDCISLGNNILGVVCVNRPGTKTCNLSPCTADNQVKYWGATCCSGYPECANIDGEVTCTCRSSPCKEKCAVTQACVKTNTNIYECQTEKACIQSGQAMIPGVDYCCRGTTAIRKQNTEWECSPCSLNMQQIPEDEAHKCCSGKVGCSNDGRWCFCSTYR